MGITIGIFGMFPWDRTNMQKIFYQGLYFMSSYENLYDPYNAHFSVKTQKNSFETSLLRTKWLWIMINFSFKKCMKGQSVRILPS